MFENVGASTPHSPKDLYNLYRNSFTFYLEIPYFTVTTEATQGKINILLPGV
jgi:hypothetical protein